MAAQAAVLCLLALAGSSATPWASGLADSSLAFVEDARNGARIVSGWEAEEGQFPFQLSLRMVNPQGGVTACGGSIVHSEWGITAAHCTATRESVVVRAGTVNLTRPYYIFETTEYYNHPLYIEALQSVVQPNDIGVIKFNRRLEFNDRVAPIRIQRSEDRDRNYADIRLTASGWGLTWTQGSSPEILNWVYLSGTSNVECLLAFGGSSIIQASTICARGYNDSTQSTCSGDSGGPLTVVDKDGKLTLVGVASFVSATGCHTDLPAGFCRPGYYHDWIREVTGIDYEDWFFEGKPVTEPQPESEPEPELEPELDEYPQPEQQLESVFKQEPQPQLEPEFKQYPQPQLEPEFKQYPQPQPQIEPEFKQYPQPQPQIEPEFKQYPQPQPKIEPEFKQYPQPQPQIEPEFKQYPQPQSQIEPEFRQYPQPQPQIEPEFKQYPQPQSQIEPEFRQYPQPQPQIEPEFKQYPQPQSQIEPEFRQYPQPQPQLEPEFKQYPQPQPQIEPEFKQYPQPQPQIEPEFKQYPEPQPQLEPEFKQYSPPQPQIEPELQQVFRYFQNQNRRK